MAKPKQSSGIKNDPEPQQDQPEPKRPTEQQGGEPTRSRRTFRPPVDIYETENGLMLVADVPGTTAEGVTVTLERRVLSVHARVEEDSPDGYSLVYREYEAGDFECQFTLAGDFDADRIEANLTNGVLRLLVPKAPEAQARTIQIKGGS